MIGIASHGATHIYRDSENVKYKTSEPESVQKKNNNTVCHHTVCESIVMGESPYTEICFWDSHRPVDKGLVQWKVEIGNIY